MERTRLLIVLILFLSCLAVFLSGEQLEKSENVAIKSGNLKIVVRYPSGEEKAAAFYLEKAALYVPAFEEYLGRPFPEKETFLIVLDNNENHAYWLMGVFLAKKHIKTLMPAVLYHEIGHYFFGGGGDMAWFVEGVNSFLPVAIMEAGLMPRDKGGYDNIFFVWAFSHFDPNKVKDRPLIEDSRDVAYKFFYSKSFKIHYLLYKELGSSKYREFIHRVLERNSVAFGEDFLSLDRDYTGLEDIIGILTDLKPIDWKKFLKGWIYPGEYEVHPMLQFKDGNKNKIPDIEEYYNENPHGLEPG
ncbi:MAG: hypothetical protein JW969_11125 [Spirochaetales bacterium]|nr:hypothetical protein [Spirochaetales bacterium]